MNDLISRQAAIDALRKMQTYKLFAGDDMILVDKAQAQTELMMLPPVQPERKTGQWIPSDSELEIKCNKCGKDFSEYVYSTDYIFLAEYPKFCPNCGADMRVSPKLLIYDDTNINIGKKNFTESGKLHTIDKECARRYLEGKIFFGFIIDAFNRIINRINEIEDVINQK